MKLRESSKSGIRLTKRKSRATSINRPCAITTDPRRENPLANAITKIVLSTMKSAGKSTMPEKSLISIRPLTSNQSLRVPHFGRLWRWKGLAMTSMNHATRRISPQSGFRSKVPFRRWWCLRYTLRPSAPQICERATGRDSSVGRATDS